MPGPPNEGVPLDTPEALLVSPKSPKEDEESDTEEAATEETHILGTKCFALDDSYLDEYLERVLAWWHGQRPPQGVEIEHTRRCV